MGVEPISSVPKTNIVSVRPQDSFESQRHDSNMDSSDYESDALPFSYVGMVPLAGLEPAKATNEPYFSPSTLSL